MDWQQLLFSFNGRQRRLHFWMVAIGIGIVSAIVGQFTYMGAYTAMLMGQHPQWGPLAMVGVVINLVLLWPSLANSVKRLHDRDKAWWFIILMWLACFTIIGALWPLIELGFLDGTQGPNKYGPSPKGVGGAAPAPTPTTVG